MNLKTSSSSRVITCRNISDVNEIICDGKIYSIRHANKKKTILSVVDSHGLIVKPMHKYLSCLISSIGLRLSEKTVKHYAYVLSYLVRWIEVKQPFGESGIEHTIRNMTRQDVVDFINYMKNETNAKSNKTLQNREAIIKDFFQWLESIEAGKLRDPESSPWGNKNNYSGANIVKAPVMSLPKVITVEMIITFLNGFYNECEKCMFHSQYDTGMRIEELINMTRGELPDERSFPKGCEYYPLVVNGNKGRGGNKKLRGTIISRVVLNRIRSYQNSMEYLLADGWDINDKNKPVFLTVNQKKWKYRNAAKQFEQAVIRSGIGEKFTSHWMRHGTAYSVLSSNMHEDIESRMVAVQKMLGHDRIRTTEQYLNMHPGLLMDSFSGSDRLLDAEIIRKRTFNNNLVKGNKR